MKHLPQTSGILHFIGIGGIGMSGIAETLHMLGYRLQGSDRAENANVKRLREGGIEVLIGHDPAHIPADTAAVITSSAIPKDNAELQHARASKIPVVRRAEMLAELMRLKRAVAVGGTHGKTTTTAMIGQMMEAADTDPTVINGGIVHAYGSNTRLGEGEIMVVEADESDGTFTRLPATIAVVTNIDPEHMDHYADFDAVRAAYLQFIQNIPFYGYAVLCADHPEVQALIPSVTDRRVITYGFSPQADICAQNIAEDVDGSTFDVEFADGFRLKDAHIPMPGRHNVQNALAALAIGREEGATPEQLRAALASFTGVNRRFTHVADIDGFTIIDDYAHHPVEIETVLTTARHVAARRGGRLIAVAQPHRYSRLHDLFEGFCTCFNEADSVIITDVYEAGENPIEGADKDALAQGIAQHGHKDVIALKSRDALPALIAQKARANDLVLFLGAGDITSWAHALPEDLKTRAA